MDPLSKGPEEGDAASTPRPAPGSASGAPGERPGSGEPPFTPRPTPPAPADPVQGVVVPPLGTGSPQDGSPQDDGAPQDQGPGAPPRAARLTQVLAGDYVITVNPVDGCEVVPARNDPAPPRRLTAEERAARGPLPAAPEGPRDAVLLERDEECDRLVQLLSRGRSVRLTGAPGSGRTAVLRAVADRVEGVAPDGVIRLSGHHRGPDDVLYDLYAAVHATEGYRPDREGLAHAVRDVGAVVVVDDIEFGGTALEELLRIAGECAFLISASPQVPAPLAGSHLEEVLLTGLSQAGCADLLRRELRRDLTAEESSWATDLWFACEGLPLRFLQATALLWQGRDGASGPVPAPSTLPSPEQSAAPVPVLAVRLHPETQAALRYAVALGGECVDHAHLPALAGARNADAALAELLAYHLITPAAEQYRLASGVLEQLSNPTVTTVVTPSVRVPVDAARHYTWWAAHPSLPPAEVAAEADPILAAVAACRDAGQHETAVRLVRSAAPQFAAALDWGAWERALRLGVQAAQSAGEVGDEAYLHHELGVLALCEGDLERSRSELENALGMRGDLGDRQGGQLGRRTLALVNDRLNGIDRTALTAAAVADDRPAPGSGTTAAGVATLLAAAEAGGLAEAAEPAAAPFPPMADPAEGRRRSGLRSRRNLAAAGAGVVIAAVLGTVVTLSASSSGDHSSGSSGSIGGTAARSDGNGGMPADQAAGSGNGSASPGQSPTAGPSAVPTAGTTGSATAPATGGAGHSGGTSPKPSKSSTKPSTGGSSSGTGTPTGGDSSSPPPTSTSPPPPSDTGGTSSGSSGSSTGTSGSAGSSSGSSGTTSGSN